MGCCELSRSTTLLFVASGFRPPSSRGLRQLRMSSSSPFASWDELSARYDGFIFDQFGVLHNGAVALEGAPELVAKLAAAGKRLGILSNSSKRKEFSLRELPKLGFSGEH